jgi:hypothetical protein
VRVLLVLPVLVLMLLLMPTPFSSCWRCWCLC